MSTVPQPQLPISNDADDLPDDDLCWEWTGTRDSEGYGVKGYKGRQWRVHRLSYMLATGEDPGEAQVLHACDNPPCFRPSHLRAGTHAENMADKIERNRCRNQYTNAESCIYGHPFTEENTYINPASNNRQCRTCRKRNNRFDKKLAHAPKATRGVLREVFRERLRQDFVFGVQNHPDGYTLLAEGSFARVARESTEAAARTGQLTWRHILGEEVAEALDESDSAKIRAELIQVAAVACAWVEAIDRRTK